jgi:hypothetical protein
MVAYFAQCINHLQAQGRGHCRIVPHDTRHEPNPHHLLIEFSLHRGQSAENDEARLGRNKGLEDSSGGASEKEARNQGHDLTCTLLAALLCHRRGFGIAGTKDRRDIVGSEAGYSAKDAGIDEINQRVKFLEREVWAKAGQK